MLELADSPVLAGLLGSEHVVRHPWRPRTALDHQVIVDVVRLDADGAGSVLTVRWSLTDGEGEVVTVKKSSYRAAVAAGDYGALAVSLSRGLGQLSREIADEIGKRKP